MVLQYLKMSVFITATRISVKSFSQQIDQFMKCFVPLSLHKVTLNMHVHDI